MTNHSALRIGTRDSDISLAQTSLVANDLCRLTDCEVILVPLEDGDDVHSALRAALFDGRCDIAVHPLEDLPPADVDGVRRVMPTRQDPRDALCANGGRQLADLHQGARVGTGSVLRAAQLRRCRPDLETVEIRGAIGTQLARVHPDTGDLDAVIVAAADLNCLGMSTAITEILDIDVMAPTPGQGAIAVEFRTTIDDHLAQALRRLNDPATALAVIAERSLLARLDGRCSAPVGAHALVSDGLLTLYAVVVRPDGSEHLRHSMSIDVADNDLPNAATLGIKVADHLLDRGAAALS